MYLIDLAEHVIVNFYRASSVLVTLMRNCVNDLAWLRLSNYRLMISDGSASDEGDTESSNNIADFTKGPPIFTATKSGCLDSNNQSAVDMIFELSNEFCTSYLPSKCNTFDQNLAVDLTRHLCLWLSHRGFTQYKISMADQ